MNARPSIVNVGYRSTNYYVVGQGGTRLLIDLGWPGTFAQLAASLKRKGLAPADLTHGLATHFHPDHAGLAEELKRAGMHLIVIDAQVTAAAHLKDLVKPGDTYIEVTLDGASVMGTSETRAYLRGIGLAGEIIATPGHSDDSVSLVLDSGEAFTGDLTHPALAFGENRDVIFNSWRALGRLGATTIHPGHGSALPIPLVDDDS